MFEFTFAGLWPIVWHYSEAIAAIAVALLIAWAFPPSRKWLLAIAVLIATHTISYTVGLNDGKDRVQKQWDAAQRVEIGEGEDARKRAVRGVGPGVPDWVRNDPANRDTWPRQGTKP